MGAGTGVGGSTQSGPQLSVGVGGGGSVGGGGRVGGGGFVGTGVRVGDTGVGETETTTPQMIWNFTTVVLNTP